MSDFRREKGVRLETMLPLIQEKLQSGGSVTFKPRGVSMRPLIRQGKDSVTVSLAVHPPKKDDVVFYRRPDGQFVLHRIVGENEAGYILCGDNQREKEYGIKADRIIGVLTAVIRSGKAMSCDSGKYSFYLKVVLPLQRVWVKVRGLFGKLKRM